MAGDALVANTRGHRWPTIIVASATSSLAAWALWRWWRSDMRGSPHDSGKPDAATAGKVRNAAQSQPVKDKVAERLRWWQRLNEIKPALVLPDLQVAPSGMSYEPTSLANACLSMAKTHQAVTAVVEERFSKGKDWLVRDSDYGSTPAHSAVKAKVNAALISAIIEVSEGILPEQLAADPKTILLLLDTPRYGSFSEIVAKFPQLRCCQQVVIPQADLGHYFEMIRDDTFYPGVRAQRLDHWLCANAKLGFRCIATFLDFECRLVGARSARLCPAADVIRYFRFGYPAEPMSVLALTVGLEEPAPTPEEVDAFVRWEAALNGYVAELRETWKYRMVSLLYIVRRADPNRPA